MKLWDKKSFLITDNRWVLLQDNTVQWGSGEYLVIELYLAESTQGRYRE